MYFKILFFFALYILHEKHNEYIYNKNCWCGTFHVRPNRVNRAYYCRCTYIKINKYFILLDIIETVAIKLKDANKCSKRKS